MAAELGSARGGFARFRMYRQFGIDEVLAKINVLRQEFEQTHGCSLVSDECRSHPTASRG